MLTLLLEYLYIDKKVKANKVIGCRLLLCLHVHSQNSGLQLHPICVALYGRK